MLNDNEYSPIVFSGPSGAGKTEFLEYLKRKDSIFEEAPGITTRERRIGEEEGDKTSFITLEEFYNHIKNGDLIQYAQYNGNYYGTLKAALELLKNKQVLFNMSFNGGKSLKELRSDSSLIYFLPPNKEELIKRMGNRDKRRYQIGIEQTMNSIEVYDYLLITYTNKLDLLYNDFMGIFLNEERGQEKSLKLAKNRDFMRNFYK